MENELKTLRRGRGLQTPRLAEQVGPLLRALCGLSEKEPSATIREKLTDRLRILAERLPGDLRLAVTIALALHPDTQQQFLSQRIQFLADLQRRDVRTIRRRMDEGFELLAELAAQPAEPPGEDGRGWRVDQTDMVLRMDKPAPERFERRKIVAESEGLDRISEIVTLIGDKVDTLDAEPYFGATLLRVDRRSNNRFEWELGLPKPLHPGDRHEYGMVLHVPIRTECLFVPDQRCTEFTLRVRFAPDRLPAMVWRVADAVPGAEAEPAPESSLPVDGAGEVTETFRVPKPGYGYGIRWQTKTTD
jgi:hypothetical protein